LTTSSSKPYWPSLGERQAGLRRRFPVWQSLTLDGLLAKNAQDHPDRLFVITDQRAWTYAQMHAWSVQLAAGLVSKGVKPGDHVALLMANFPEFVAVKFAISMVGAVAVPINFLNKRDELGYVLKQSDAVMLITMDSFRNMPYWRYLDELAPGWQRQGGGDVFPKLKNVIVFATGEISTDTWFKDCTLLSQLGAGLGLPPVTHPGPGATCDIIYTSGTTGFPKGVVLTHDMMLRTAFGSAWARGFEDARRILFSLPLYHVYGYVEGLLACMFVGGAIVAQTKFDAKTTLEAIDTHQATDILLIPAMTLALIDEQKTHHHPVPSLQSVLSSGGRAPASIWQQILVHLQPQEITTGYGMTEVTASSTVTQPTDHQDRWLHTNGRLRDVGPAGYPELGNRLVIYRVVDPETGQVVARGQVGELQAKGPGVTSGYYNKPQETSAAFTRDGWLHTGDLGRLDEDDYISLAGRLKESYRCGGELVMPTEAEDVLMSHPAVLQAHVVPVPDERMGEIGVAFVVLREQTVCEAAALQSMCAERLARFKVPKHVLFVSAQDVPVTPSGRARKFLLSHMAMQSLGLSVPA
jgi:fatty-acyl-CoA synthase